MTTVRIANVRPYGEDPTDLFVRDGVLVEPVADPDETVDADGLIALAEPRADGTLKPVVGFRG